MKIDGAGSLGTASVIHKVEELPYEGKAPVESRTDSHGMKLEGSADSSEGSFIGRNIEENEEKE